MTNERDMKEKWQKLCTASNKAFLCISSRIVTLFLIEQSYVAKTSCKMSAKHLRFSRWHVNLPLWTKQPNILLSSCRSEYIFSIGSMKDDRSFKRRRRKQKRGVTLGRSAVPPSTTLISWLAWWPCYEEESRDGCRWAFSFRLVSKSTKRNWKFLNETVLT